MLDLSNDLNKTIKKLTRLKHLLKEYQHLITEDNINNAYKLDEILHNLNKLAKETEFATFGEKFDTLFATEIAKIEEYKEEFRHCFGRLFENELKVINLDLRGQYPNLYLGLYTIKIDFNNYQAKLFWGPEYIKRTNLEPVAIKEAIISFEKELNNRKFIPEQFLEYLKQAYKRIDKEDTNKALLTNVLYELACLMQSDKFKEEPIKSNFTSYSRAYFGYDLYRLRTFVDIKKYDIMLHPATFDKTKDRKNVLFIPTDATGGNYYSHISILI